jgi:hypothetical protein
VLAYLSRYTYRMAIANSRLLGFDGRAVTFRWKDDRAKGRTRQKVMTLTAEEFMRRFLLHVLPSGLHPIRHFGLLANARRRVNLAQARAGLDVPAEPLSMLEPEASHSPGAPTWFCPHCHAAWVIIEVLPRGLRNRSPPECRGGP